jgi:hypothetical protein
MCVREKSQLPQQQWAFGPDNMVGSVRFTLVTKESTESNFQDDR